MTEAAQSAFRRRRLAVAAAAVLVLLAGAHTALWWVVTSRIIQGIPDFVAAAADSGWALQTGAPRRAGWPFAATVVLPDVSATRPLGGATLHWTVHQLAISLRPTAPTLLELEPEGTQTIETGSGPAFQLHAETARLLVPLTGQTPATLRATGISLLTGTGDGAEAGVIEMRFDATSIDAMLQALTPVPHLPTPFSGGAELSIHATTNEPFRQAASPAESARAWQTAGGQMQVSTFILHWGPLQAEGHGTFSLDGQLQPVGRAVVNASGVDTVLDAAVRSGQMQPGPALAAKAVLSLMALASGGRSPVLPLQLQDRTLTIANFPVLRLPLLVWSAP